jgi:hypothetical protein
LCRTSPSSSPPYLPLLSNCTVQYSAVCAYISGVPFSLSLSFFPLLLAQFGHGESVSGVLLALRSVGAIGAALIAARFVRSGPRTLWPVVWGLMIVCTVGSLPALNVAPLMMGFLADRYGLAAMRRWAFRA